MSDECCARTRLECENDCDEYVKQLKQQLKEAVEVIERMKCNEDIDSEDCPKCSFLAKYRGEK